MPENQSSAHWLQRLLIGRNPRRTLLRACILAALTFITFRFAVLPIQVEGRSMVPACSDRSIHFLNRLAYWRHAPERGDIVGIRFSGPHNMLLKRVVGLPGERIGFAGGRVTVNSQSLDERYVKLPSNWQRADVLVGPDEYFVVGDNRSMPIQDHTFGMAKRERILGKLVL
jgi:signal peptidase I